MEVRWVASTEGEIALAAAGTAKTILNVISAAGKVNRVLEINASLDATPSEPVVLELCRSTQAGAGSGSSAVTLRPENGIIAATVGSTAAKGYTGEPTVLTPLRDAWTLPDKAPFIYQLPLGREPEGLDGDGLCLRFTLPTGGTPVPNVRALMVIKEG